LLTGAGADWTAAFALDFASCAGLAATGAADVTDNIKQSETFNR